MAQYAQYPASSSSGGGSNVTIVGPLGQTVMANSIPVTIASDQSALPISQGSGLTVTGSLSATGAIISTDAGAYNSVALLLSGVWANCTMWFQCSVDGSTWYNWPMMPTPDLGNSNLVDVVTTNGLWVTQLNARYFRVFVFIYGSGTVTATAYFKYNGNALPLSAGAGGFAINTVTSATTLFTQDCSQYNNASVQITGIGSGNTVQFQASNNNSTWSPCFLTQAGGSSPTVASDITTTGIWSGSINYKYFRAVVTIYGSGPVTACASFRFQPYSPNVLLASQNGNWSSRTQDGSGTAITSMTVGAKQAFDINLVGTTLKQFITNDYSSVNVTTSAYVQLIASTSSVYQVLEVYDTGGQIMKIAFGAAASEVDQFAVPQGGNGAIRIYVPASTRVSIKAISATANTGYLVLNCYG